MNPTLIVQVIRWMSGFLAIAHIFGIAMFWSTNHASALAVPSALAVSALGRPTVSVAAVASLLAVAGYLTGGIPFLDPQLELDVRALHLAELLLLSLLIAVAVRESIKSVLP